MPSASLPSPFILPALTAALGLIGTSRLSAEIVFSDTFDYTAANAFVEEGGWNYWSGTGGSGAGSGFCWGQNIVLEHVHPDTLEAGDNLSMAATLNRPWSGYLYGMRIVLWDGNDEASRVEVAGGTYQGNALPQVSYAVTPADITAGLDHVIFRYSHDGNWGETQEVSFSVEPPPSGWTWATATGGSWDEASNWSPLGPASGADQAALIHLADIAGDQVITLDNMPTIGSLWFGDAAGDDGNWILSPGTGGPLTLSAPTSGSPEVLVSNQTATLSVVLAGSEGLTKSGAGTLALAAANAYNGDTTVTGGILRLDDPAGIPSGPGAGNLILNGTLDLAESDATINGLGGNGTVTNSGTGTPTLTLGAGDADGVTFAGAIQDGGGVTSLTKIGAGTLTFTGIHTLSGSILVDEGRLIMTGGFNRYHSMSSVHVAAGATAELDGGNMFVGNHTTPLDPSRVLSANGGTLFMNSNMESRIGNVELSNGATWTIDRGLGAWDVLLADTTAGPSTVTVADTGESTSPSQINGVGGLHLQGLQNFDVQDVTGDAADDLIVELPLADPGNTGGAAGGIRKLGNGTMRLRGVNSYTGDTVVEEGRLVLEEYSLLRFIVGDDGVNNRVSGTGSVLLDGDFDIDLSGADATNGNQWILVDAAQADYGPGFFIPDFIETDDVHTFDDGTAVWTFTEATGTLTVTSGLDFADWAAANAGNQTADEDFDSDGTPNGVEFFMGETGSSFTPRPALVGGTVTWPKDPEANASYVVETSSTLQDELAPGDGGWTPATSGVVDTGTTVSFTPPVGETKYFIRLRVILP